MTKFATLVSGSSGNAVFLSHKNTSILIDCGISGTALKEYMQKIGENPEDLDFILVTHEHVDHTRGVGVLSRKYDIPICASVGTWTGMEIGAVKSENEFAFSENKPFEIGDIIVSPFDIPHDALQPTGYCFDLDGVKVSVATDIGCITDEVRGALTGSDVVVLESNHDLDMLEKGKYHPQLKRRVRSNLGHLCNVDAGNFAADLIKSGTKRILLGHLSNENNNPLLAYNTVAQCLADQCITANKDAWIAVAKRYDITPIFGVGVC